MNDEDRSRVQRRIYRERKARKEAEQLLEQKSLELYTTNNSLLETHRKLEARTIELQTINAQLEAEIAERQKAQDALEERSKMLAEARDRAEMANQAKTVFLATMSHELRTPLNAIIGYTEMTLEELLEGVISDDAVRDVGRVKESADHLLHLINTILDLSKVETGEEEIFLAEVAIEKVLNQVCKLSWPLVERSGNRLRIDVFDSVPEMIVTDQKKLCQIIVNLVSNAAKFTENGLITLSVKPVTNVGAIEFSIEDNGIGIPEDQVTQLFEPFQQLDNLYNRKYSGSGLGLAISKKYCDLLGGGLSYEPREAGGARFTVRVPSSQKNKREMMNATNKNSMAK